MGLSDNAQAERDERHLVICREVHLSFRLSVYLSEAGTLLLHPKNLKCKLNLD